MRNSIYTLLILFSSTCFGAQSVSMKQYPRGHWGVDVTINGTVTYPFIIDTGAQGAIFPTQLVEALNLDTANLEETILQGAAGSRSMKRLVVDSLAIGDESVTNIDGVIMDLPMKGSGSRPPGVLPYTFLNQFKPEFDLAEQKLTLHPKQKKLINVEEEQKFDVVPFSLVHGSFISITLNLNGQDVTATLDSGAGGRLDINWKAAKSIGITPENPQLSEGEVIRGAGGGELQTKKYPAVSVKVDELLLANRAVTISDMPVMNLLHGDKAAANVGMGIFGQRRVIIDYENKRLLLSKSVS